MLYIHRYVMYAWVEIATTQDRTYNSGTEH